MRRGGAAAPVEREPGLSYQEFLARKAVLAPVDGFEVDASEVHPLLKPFQRQAVLWAIRGGRRALFERYGLGKTVQQIEFVRLTLTRTGGRGLIVLPLGVRQEFTRDAAMLGVPVTFIRRIEEAGPEGIYLTNYETIRDNKLDPTVFSVTSLDEAACLRGFGGSRTFREFMRYFEGSGKYRLVATAVPSPNDYIEMLAYAAFLDVMDVAHAKTKFFKRDSEKADALTLHPHKEREFWLWVSSWALFLQSPSDLGDDDTGYTLPPIEVRWHELPSDHASAGAERDGQGKMFRDAAYGVSDAAREKRDTLPARIAKLMELRAEDPGAHRLLWHDLEDERRAIETAIPGVVSVYGSQDLEDREAAIIGFSNGEFPELAGKPSVAGVGCNFQRHCAWAIFLGIGFKFHDFAQAVHRVQRFLQTRPVRIDLIYTEAERPIRRVLEEKWARHDAQTARMSEIIREYGLAESAMASALLRSIGVERREISGERYRLINADAVEETARLDSDSVGLILTSIPFGTQYEYTSSYNDFGHTDDAEHFWAQMDYLTPELLRVLQPGRVLVVHVKDRITPGGITKLGFQTVAPFHAEAIFHHRRHGFAYLGMKTVVTDVVRENNQTYRLGWTEQCKDGSRMGCGMPEYVLLFRKPPTDASNGYADVPVVKAKREWREGQWINPEGYSRARWQVDAAGFVRDGGNRLLTPSELVGLPADTCFQRYRAQSLAEVYDVEHHVACAEAREEAGQLPKKFALLPAHSWHPDVLDETDVARMRTLNTMQALKGKEQHLCPLPLQLVKRLIVQLSNEGDVVYDPFCGIGTVPSVAIETRRYGLGVDLSPLFWRTAAGYCEDAERKLSSPTLFDLIRAEERVDL